MQSLDYTGTVQDDVIALLTAAGVTNPHRAGIKHTPAAAGVAVGAEYRRETLFAGQRALGFPEIDVTLDCYSYLGDDADGSTARALAKAANEVLMIDDQIAQLNALSSYATYFHVTPGPAAVSIEDQRRHHAYTYTLLMQPSNATTTTTTTT